MSQSEQSVKCASEQLMTQNWEEINTLTEKLKEANELKQNLQNQLDAYQQKGDLICLDCTQFSDRLRFQTPYLLFQFNVQAT